MAMEDACCALSQAHERVQQVQSQFEDEVARLKDQQQDYLLSEDWNGKTVYLMNTKSGTCLDVEGGREDNGTKVHGWEFIRSTAQQWKLERLGDSVWSPWTIRNIGSGKYLTLWDGGGDNETRIVSWEQRRGNANVMYELLSEKRLNDPVLQQWFIIPKGSDTQRCLIQSASTCQYLDLLWGMRENGTRVQSWTRAEEIGNQYWEIKAVDERPLNYIPGPWDIVANQLLADLSP